MHYSSIEKAAINTQKNNIGKLYYNNNEQKYDKYNNMSNDT